MTTSQAIHTNTQYHSELLRALDLLEYAPSALTEQTTYLQDLQANLARVKERVEGLAEKTKKEKEYEGLRDSAVRRMASRVVGRKEKFKEKQRKGEREYIEALEAETRERENQAMVEEMILEANTTKLDLQEKSDRLTLVQQELSDLYETVFGGLTEEFPRDDQLKDRLKSARETYDTIQARLNSDSQAVKLLERAEKMRQTCLNYLNEASDYGSSGTLLWFLADYISWDFRIMEQKALNNASMTASQMNSLLQQAQRASPLVQPTSVPRIHDISGDIFFSLDTRGKIKSSKSQLIQAHEHLKSELLAAQERAQQTEADFSEASKVLSECRVQLETFRRETFERIGGVPSVTGNNIEVGRGGRESLPSIHQ
ncbi:hypothetical protein K435DRAFT_279654 [Dendrothele bispora CBS 962.96]|uniref:Uncharacterized protein n=1 Tax=Dendrothele bispora (strain CBS 962.96) TaxID=1314807 RepID=A0A4V6T5M6_DENBC|nr:hypothetical protein K435DRAFT_279654 [Dendrothele bispora CBS 962.96]